MLYDILREVGEDLRAVAKTKISDMARGESKSHVSQSTLSKITVVDGTSTYISLFMYIDHQYKFYCNANF